jgi:hypothetical protein
VWYLSQINLASRNESTAGLPRIQRELRVEHTALDRELFQEELETITAVDIVDENDAFAFDQLELENHVGKKELVDFRAANSVLGQETSLVFSFL